MQKEIIVKGIIFGRLIVLGEDGNHKNRRVICECDCGNKKSILWQHVKREKIRSCGCFMVEKRKQGNNRSHGMTGTRPFNIWCCMRQRCDDKNCTTYKNYGGKGTSYETRRRKFENFREDMSETYKDGLTLDRIDNFLGYSKKNCRWATREQQQNNRTNNIIYKGVSLRRYCINNGLNYGSVRSRIKREKITIEESIRRQLIINNQ